VVGAEVNARTVVQSGVLVQDRVLVFSDAVAKTWSNNRASSGCHQVRVFPG
jgi:hypothetical protein